jgi:hypothetical protein
LIKGLLGISHGVAIIGDSHQSYLPCLEHKVGSHRYMRFPAKGPVMRSVVTSPGGARTCRPYLDLIRRVGSVRRFRPTRDEADAGSDAGVGCINHQLADSLIAARCVGWHIE